KRHGMLHRRSTISRPTRESAPATLTVASTTPSLVSSTVLYSARPDLYSVRPEPVEGRAHQHGSWFDKLTTSGVQKSRTLQTRQAPAFSSKKITSSKLSGF